MGDLFYFVKPAAYVSGAQEEANPGDWFGEVEVSVIKLPKTLQSFVC
ncbi:hypothetical protein [Cecembia rubra]|uniref:Uncharacterized protein n=1 Tax=Cecembia rubra TaxID=1485585 RepID=A0A2P8E5V2_9BACT|nr:hypothetical protein [Cecembia rubra]PSL04840.1 hypothetical protein CLV48_10414 [Cecembia rubra]